MANQTDRAQTVFGPTSGDTDAYPRLDMNRQNPQVDAVITKLVSANDSSFTKQRSNQPMRAPDMQLLQKISDVTAGNVSASDSLMQMLPDTELTAQILVSSILSPKDMVNSELTYAVEPGLFRSELSGAMLDCIRNYFQNVYKMDDILPEILEDALFRKGAYPLLVLPENSIDDAINSPQRVSMEDIADEIDTTNKCLRPLGLLGNRPAAGAIATTDMFGLESLDTDFRTGLQGREYNPVVSFEGDFNPHLTITDNINAVKMPMLSAKIREDRVQDVLSVRKLSMEAFRTDAKEDPNRSLARRRRYKHVPIAAITPPSHLKKKAVGHPMVMHLPSEAVIPVHVPSNPSDHLGYFILLDQAGNPLCKTEDIDYYADLQNQLQGAGHDAANQMIGTARQSLYGGQEALQNANARQMEVQELERIYGDLVENELYSRLKSGVYGDNVKVARPEQIYRIMLSRALAKMHTQAVYVPAELMAYFAFDFNQYGVGQSLLQKSKIIGGLRAMLLMATTMGALKNSIGRTNLNITLDPNDGDPAGTVEYMLTEYSKTRQAGFPLGMSRPHDLATYLQNAAVEVTVQGNAAYPETKMSVEDKQSARAQVSPELEKMLRDRHLMSMGVSPETVDASAGAEFATQVTNNNLLLAKRVVVYQGQFVSMLQEFLQCYTLNSGALMDELRKIVEENMDKLTDEQQKAVDELKAKKPAAKQDDTEDEPAQEICVDGVIVDFVEAIRLSLPSPDTATLKNQMEAYGEYEAALDKVLSMYLDSGFLEATAMGKMQELIEPTIKAVKAYFMRQWLRNNNVLPEVDDLTTFSEDDGPAINLLDTHEAHVESIGKALLTYMEHLYKARAENDKKAEAIIDATGGEPVSTTPTDGGDGGNGMGDGNDDLGGMGELPAVDGDGSKTDDTSTDTNGGDADEAADPDLGGKHLDDALADPKPTSKDKDADKKDDSGKPDDLKA